MTSGQTPRDICINLEPTVRLEFPQFTKFECVVVLCQNSIEIGCKLWKLEPKRDENLVVKKRSGTQR